MFKKMIKNLSNKELESYLKMFSHGLERLEKFYTFRKQALKLNIRIVKSELNNRRKGKNDKKRAG